MSRVPKRLVISAKHNPERFGTVLGDRPNNPGYVEIAPFDEKMTQRALRVGAYVPPEDQPKSGRGDGPQALKELL